MWLIGVIFWRYSSILSLILKRLFVAHITTHRGYLAVYQLYRKFWSRYFWLEFPSTYLASFGKWVVNYVHVLSGCDLCLSMTTEYVIIPKIAIKTPTKALSPSARPDMIHPIATIEQVFTWPTTVLETGPVCAMIKNWEMLIKQAKNPDFMRVSFNIYNW